MAEKKKRITVAQIRKMLEQQVELDAVELSNARRGLPCLKMMEVVEHCRARAQFCKDLLKKIDTPRKS